MGIRCLKADYTYTTAIRKGALLEIERQSFAIELGKAIKSGKHIVYMDETTCNTWACKRRFWMFKDDPILNGVNPKKTSATLIGAIS